MNSVQLINGTGKAAALEGFQGLTLCNELGCAPSMTVALPVASRDIGLAACVNGLLKVRLSDETWLGPTPGAEAASWHFTGGKELGPVKGAESTPLTEFYGSHLDPALEAWLARVPTVPGEPDWLLWQRAPQEALDDCVSRILGGYMVSRGTLARSAGAGGIAEGTAWVRPAAWSNRQFLDAFVEHLKFSGLPVAGWLVDGKKANALDLLVEPAGVKGLLELDLEDWTLCEAGAWSMTMETLCPPAQAGLIILSRKIEGIKTATAEQVNDFVFGDQPEVNIGGVKIPRRPAFMRISIASEPARMFLARRIKLGLVMTAKGTISGGSCEIHLEPPSRHPARAALPSIRLDSSFKAWDSTGAWTQVHPPGPPKWQVIHKCPTKVETEKRGLFVRALSPGRHRKNMPAGLLLALEEGDGWSLRVDSGLCPIGEGILQQRDDVPKEQAALLRLHDQSVTVDARKVDVAGNIEVTREQLKAKGRLVVDKDATFQDAKVTIS